MKQFEAAIGKIAAEVQNLNPHAVRGEIRQLESDIDSLHGRLIRVDRDIGHWAAINLKAIELDGQRMESQDAARQVVEGAERYRFLPDQLGISPDFEPRFSNSDVVELRDARRNLGADSSYLGCSLPPSAQFPDLGALLQVHQDLSQFARLTAQIQNGNVHALGETGPQGIEAAQRLLDRLVAIKELRTGIFARQQSSALRMRELLKSGRSEDLLKMLNDLGEELVTAYKERTDYIRKPVTAPSDADQDQVLVSAVNSLAEGRSPFGLLSFGKGALRLTIESIKVLNRKPKENEEWRHVYWYLRFRANLRVLAIRWNALTLDLPLDPVSGEGPEHGLDAADQFHLHVQLRALVSAEQELTHLAVRLFPSWSAIKGVTEDSDLFSQLERALNHHLIKNRLSAVWRTKESLRKTLEGKNGAIVVRIREFIDRVLGNPAVDDNGMQAHWSQLTAELARVHGLRGYLTSLARVTELIEASGAPKYAQLLRAPMAASVDTLLPDDWRESWRLRRLATHLEAIDAYDALKQLGRQRSTIESDLTGAYQRLVEKRTWLKLHERSTDRVRAALQAYLEAIKRIGKGTGKRAAIYRQDARRASSRGSVAVPC